jgi:hypothetical protein
VAHLVAIAFFAGLLVVLAVVLEQIVKAHWGEIASALKGAPVRTEARPRPAARRAAA